MELCCVEMWQKCRYRLEKSDRYFYAKNCGKILFLEVQLNCGKIILADRFIGHV